MPSYPTRPPYHHEHTYFVLPTYACNLRCAHCATSDQGDDVGSMSLEEFSGILRSLTAEIDGRVELRFIGGEPAIWKPINQALALAREMPQVRTSVFSNCTHSLTTLPRWLFFAINSWFTSPASRAQAKAVFAAYHEKISSSFSLTVRYVVTEQTTDQEVRDFAAFVGEFPGASVGIGFDVELFGRDVLPSPEQCHALGKQVIHTLHAATDVVGVERVRVQDIFPLCLFTDEELARLRESYLIRGICTSPEGSVVFLPGGLVQLCPNVTHRTQREPSTRLSALAKGFDHACEQLRWSPRQRCAECAHYAARECQGGCLGPSLRLLERAGQSPLATLPQLPAELRSRACACQ